MIILFLKGEICYGFILGRSVRVIHSLLDIVNGHIVNSQQVTVSS